MKKVVVVHEACISLVEGMEEREKVVEEGKGLHGREEGDHLPLRRRLGEGPSPLATFARAGRVARCASFARLLVGFLASFASRGWHWFLVNFAK
jgi:hypothetical protein